MSGVPLPDQQARHQALDVSRSCIVQAPAGSGKTELLTLRFLRLLSICEQPEEVLAITFTRKAASEMRDRIIQALCSARATMESGRRPEREFERLRLEIATAVLRQDSTRQWRLTENPSRLRVQTIDSFCFYLARQLPVMSHVGGNPAVSEDVNACLSDAIGNTLDQLEGEGGLADDIEILLEHADNDRGQAEQLLTNLLYKREQWLPYVLELRGRPDLARHYLARNLDELVSESLARLNSLLEPVATDLMALFNFSTGNLMATDKPPFTAFQGLQHLPEASSEALPYWRRLAGMLLTNKGEWRKSITVRDGFPAGDKQDPRRDAECGEQKDLFHRVREALAQIPELESLIAEIKLLPQPDQPERRWRFLAALMNILAHLGGELLLAFRKFHLLDYTEISSAALTALGPADDPTDIALALDHRLCHILVDEFQDTSHVQLQLLERLTAGWQAEDGRSLFLVGDPMQSIYGFRNANVGIFLRVREHGINNVSLDPLTLSANFRSQANIVDWVNAVFAPAFPARPDSSRGAVPYAPSQWVYPALDQATVTALLITYDGDRRRDACLFEAQRVLAKVQDLQSIDPEAEIAILARTRPQLAPIVQCLGEAGISWQAADIDRLDRMMPVEDLLSLTRALLNPGDRVAWLALLRAPWCGLTSEALLEIADKSPTQSLWTTLQTPAALAGLEGSVRTRLSDLVEVLRLAMAMRFRRPLRQLVESTWTLLRGVDCCRSEMELASAAKFFELLEQHDQAGGLPNPFEFLERLSRAFAPAPALPGKPGSVKLLTMHKAKGLEFDHVILPCLDQVSATDTRELLLWHERLNQAGRSQLFLAAKSATGDEDDELYRLLQQEMRIKRDLEATRLLYIAVTRAKKSATLTAALRRKDVQPQAPDRRSLLYPIWPQLQSRPGPVREIPLPDILTAPVPGARTADESGTPIRRLLDGIRLSPGEAELLREQRELLVPVDDIASRTADEYESSLAQCIGRLIHSALENHVTRPALLATHGEALRQYWRRELQRVCEDRDTLAKAMTFIEQSLARALDDNEHGWIFDHRLKASACELAVSSRGPHGLREHVIDRTFIDGEGVRWIIDYKTPAPRAGQSRATFIAEQQARYAEQLAVYRDLFARMESGPVRTALYFTALPQLVEVDQASPSATA